MKRAVAVAAATVSVLLSVSAPAFAQKRTLVGLAGIFTVVTGALVAMPLNLEGNSHEILGKDYCVIDRYGDQFDVKDRACEMTDGHPKAGGITMAIGGGLVVYGFWPEKKGSPQVKVAPVLGKKVKGAKLTIQW